MGLTLVTPPESFPVTLEEVKAQLSIEDNDWDDMLTGMIEAAVAHLEGPFGDLCGRALMPQTWDYFRDSFPGDVNFPSANGYYGNTNVLGGIRIPLPPLISVDSVNYVDPDTQMEVELSQSEYEVDVAGLPYGWVMPITTGWPPTFTVVNAVRIRFTAGYPDTQDSPVRTTVPAGVRQAIMLLVIDMYGRGSAFVDRAQTANLVAYENLIRQHVIRQV